MSEENTPILIERFTDNGEHSHWVLINDKGQEIASEEHELKLSEQSEEIKNLKIECESRHEVDCALREKIQQLKSQLEEKSEEVEKCKALANIQRQKWIERTETLQSKINKLTEALTEIAEGKGRYSTDQFTHARNTIEDMKELANEAIKEN